SVQAKLRKGQELSATDRRRYERLVGKAAGDDRLFPRKREEAERAAKQKAEAERLHVSMLPKRAVLAEPGSIGLPRLCHKWLTESRDGRWGVLDVGLLGTILLCLENQSCDGILTGVQVEADADGEPVLVIPRGSLRDMFRVHPTCSPSGMTGWTSAVL